MAKQHTEVPLISCCREFERIYTYPSKVGKEQYTVVVSDVYNFFSEKKMGYLFVIIHEYTTYDQNSITRYRAIGQ